MRKNILGVAISLTFLSALTMPAAAMALEAPPPQATPIVAGTMVIPVTGYCAGGYSQGMVATPSNISQAQSNIVNAMDSIYFNDWQPLYEAEQGKNRAANLDNMKALMTYEGMQTKAQQEARLKRYEQNNAQMPPSMPCGGQNCTGQENMAATIAGGGGVMGTLNTVSGAGAMSTKVSTTLTSKEGAKEPLQTYAVHCGDFATAAEITAGVCTGAAGVKPDADIVGTTLLSSPPVSTDAVHVNKDALARKQLIDNLVQAPPPALRNKNFYKTVGGQAIEGKVMADRARVNLSRTVLSQINAMNTPQNGLGAKFSKTISKNAPGSKPLASNPTLVQALSWQDQATYGNPGWYVQIAKMSKSALAKEQILMKAQQLQYEYLAFRERTNIEAVLATMLAEKTQQVNSKQKLQAIANTPETPAAG
ncbi:hypothetical protein A4U49_01505 [Acidithiobacillus ferrivorans]|uniref:hypothetical protein n=1 Tax=Acidithiobacillus ferrivorans TaxID=160808 RepID=UPI00089339F6|nr:hypothetical protein [Acidithiobacillus ferrivorans]OFA17562.1 hypothetical protein A4U49_01505 [Acidithiobacillus ferrivorans]